MSTFKKYLIAGLLVWLPLAATLFIIGLFIELLDRTILLLPESYRPESLLGFHVPGMGVFLALGVLLLTGMLAANLLGRKTVELWENILNRIPLVRSIYNSVKQISSTILTSSGKSFRKVVLVEYPRDGVWSMGFLTNEDLDLATDIPGTGMSAVFVPTAPNPTSGFIIMASRGEIIELDLSIEDGFKYIISMGVIVPDRQLGGVKLAKTTGDT